MRGYIKRFRRHADKDSGILVWWQAEEQEVLLVAPTGYKRGGVMITNFHLFKVNLTERLPDQFGNDDLIRWVARKLREEKNMEKKEELSGLTTVEL